MTYLSNTPPPKPADSAARQATQSRRRAGKRSAPVSIQKATEGRDTYVGCWPP